MKISGKRFLTVSLLCLAGLIGWLCFRLEAPRQKPVTIGILLSRHTPMSVRFLKGLRLILAKQGYRQGANLRFLIRDYHSVAEAGQRLDQLVQKGAEMVVIAGDDPLGAIARRNLHRPVILGFVDNPIRKPAQQRIESAKMVTGVSYFPPYERLLDLSRRVVGNYSRLTVLGDANQAWDDWDRFQAAARRFGIALQLVQCDFSGIPQTLASLKGKTDLLYLPGQSAWITRRRFIGAALEKAGLPTISNNMAFRDFTVLSDYAEPETMGEIAGQIVIKIKHGAVPRYLPVELSADYKLIVNLRLLNRYRLPVNEDVLSYANEVIR